MSKHEFIDVLNRRWCMCCDLFQSKKPNEVWWEPKTECPRSTPYAIKIDSEPSPAVLLTNGHRGGER